jgi:hypothetical protein
LKETKMRTLTILVLSLFAIGSIFAGCGKETMKPVKDGASKTPVEKVEPKEAAGEKTDPGKPEEAEPAGKPAPAKGAGPQLLDLGSVGIEATMEAPEGAKAKASEWGDITVKKGDGFDITIAEDAADLAARKKEIEANDVNKLKGFEIETEDVLLYRSEVMGREEYHFLTNMKVGDKAYSLENTKGPSYTKEQAEAMLKAARSMKAK